MRITCHVCGVMKGKSSRKETAMKNLPDNFLISFFSKDRSVGGFYREGLDFFIPSVVGSVHVSCFLMDFLAAVLESKTTLSIQMASPCNLD